MIDSDNLGDANGYLPDHFHEVMELRLVVQQFANWKITMFVIGKSSNQTANAMVMNIPPIILSIHTIFPF